MFSEQEVAVGCDITFKPTLDQLAYLAQRPDGWGHLHGTVLRKIAGVPCWFVTLRSRTVIVSDDAIAILSGDTEHELARYVGMERTVS